MVPQHALGGAGVDEAAVLIMAIRRSNMPKFLLDDAVLFNAIVSDLFPGMDVPEQVGFSHLNGLTRHYQPGALCVHSTLAALSSGTERKCYASA